MDFGFGSCGLVGLFCSLICFCWIVVCLLWLCDFSLILRLYVLWLIVVVYVVCLLLCCLIGGFVVGLFGGIVCDLFWFVVYCSLLCLDVWLLLVCVCV